jgi:hypothetical protein
MPARGFRKADDGSWYKVDAEDATPAEKPKRASLRRKTPAEKLTLEDLKAAGAPTGEEQALAAGAPEQALAEAGAGASPVPGGAAPLLVTPSAKRSRQAPPASPPRDQNGINADYMNTLQEALDTVHAHKVFETIKTDDPLQITEHDVDETNFKATLSEI